MQQRQRILTEYRAKRQAAIAAAAENRAKAEAKLPRLREIEEMQRRLAFALGLKLVTAADKDAVRKDTETQIAALEREAELLLADHGIAPESLKPRFECEICEDTGFVGAEKQPCACFKKRLLQAEYASSGLAENARFALFDESIYRDETQKKRSLKAKRILEEYAQTLSFNDAKGLMLLGAVGVGKTFLLDCVGHAAMENGFTVKKYTAYNLVDRMLQGIRERESGLAALTKPDLLLIDDLGTEPFIQNITYEGLFGIVNERQNAGKATAIATNLSPKEILDAYGERLFSRLTSPRLFTVLELKGESLR
ncbi:MAG: hypothetical protein E7330_01280 [Clostridiales bacterium]|nr:hypothetical protein [Clostridiales bacterium]